MSPCRTAATLLMLGFALAAHADEELRPLDLSDAQTASSLIAVDHLGLTAFGVHPYETFWAPILEQVVDEPSAEADLAAEPQGQPAPAEPFDLATACPAELPSHARYLRCVAHATRTAVEEGRLTQDARWRLLRDAARPRE